mmetsp:Transcript_5598/g.17686  ORF Transcript_5598/g.17686 Transcript_5598/m.17686 type:complete len:250 (+) Transcript_5598:528-1277(+)
MPAPLSLRSPRLLFSSSSRVLTYSFLLTLRRGRSRHAALFSECRAGGQCRKGMIVVVVVVGRNVEEVVQGEVEVARGDAVEGEPFLGVDDGDDGTRSTAAAGAAGAVEVGHGVAGGVEVEDDEEVGQIQAPRREVRGQKHVDLVPAHGVDGFPSRLEVVGFVQNSDRVAIDVAEGLCEVAQHGPALFGEEDEHGTEARLGLERSQDSPRHCQSLREGLEFGDEVREPGRQSPRLHGEVFRRRAVDAPVG